MTDVYSMGVFQGSRVKIEIKRGQLNIVQNNKNK